MKNAIKFISITFFLLILGEILVRYTITSPSAAIEDRQLGWIFKPHSTIFHTREGWATNTLNSLGFNDQEIDHNSTKQNILVLGDSYTEALQVKRSENFTSISEQALACTNFINAGRSALSPIQYPIMLNRFSNKTTINHIIIVLTYGDLSDIINNKARILRDSDNQYITDIVLQEKKMHWIREKTAFIFAHSSLATYLKNRIKSIKNNEDADFNDNAAKNNNRLEKAKFTTDILTYVFKKMDKHSPLSVLYIPNLTFYTKGNSKQTTESKLFENLIRNSAMNANINFLSAGAAMQKSYQDNGQPPVGFVNKSVLGGHLNKSGHQVISLVIQKLINIDCIS